MSHNNMSNQLDMFGLDPDQVYHYDGDIGYVCNNCGIRQPPDQFQHMQSGEVKRKCNTCRRGQSALVRALRKANPYPTDPAYECPICSRTMDEISQHGQLRLQTWVLDHCHDTETFRGWLCFNCNSGLGQFKDDLLRIQSAVRYLENHENENSS